VYKILKGKSLEANREKLKKLNTNIELEEDDLVFIAYNEEEIVGYANVKVMSKDIAILKDIYIKEELRYSSRGVNLMEYVKNYISARGIDKIIFEQIGINVEFFRKAGFIEKETGKFEIDGLLAKKNREKQGINSTLLSIVINVILAIIKIVFGIIGKSKALVADGFHSASDVVGSLIVLVGVYFGNKPADEKHPYGHGKLESIAGNMIGVILVITAYSIIVENIMDYLHGAERVIPEKITLVIVIISIVIKYLLYKYKYNIGIKIKNDAVLADAREHKSDVLSSVGVLIGILLSIYVNPIFDLLLSIIVGVIIGKEGLSIIFETSNNLMDVQDKELVEEISKYVDNFDYVQNTHDIRMQTSGNMIYISLHIRLDGDMTIYQGHELADEIKYAILADFDDIEDVMIHMDSAL
jgi:cation diffusion facilitator family transporter